MNIKSRIVLVPILLLASLLSFSASAEDPKGYKSDMEDSLKLSESQKQQINAIEQRFRQAMNEKKAAGASREEMKALMKKKLQSMRDEVASVLTDAQKSLAQKQVREQNQKRIKRYLSQLAQQLELSDQQKAQVRQTLNSIKGSWPMDKSQMDAERQRFNRSLEGILNKDQLQTWQEIKDKTKNKWKNHTEESLGDY